MYKCGTRNRNQHNFCLANDDERFTPIDCVLKVFRLIPGICVEWIEKQQKIPKMDSHEFRRRGTEMVEYICKYMETLEERRVTPSVEPGYLRHLLPDEAPQEPEEWNAIMDDVETKIMPGVTHWQHPRFHAYFPAGNSYPSILGDMLSDGIGCIGFSWAASPACTELETIVLDWLGKAIGLPDDFLALKKGSKGGGVIQVNFWAFLFNFGHVIFSVLNWIC